MPVPFFQRRIEADMNTHIAVARFEGAEETIFASRCVSAVLSFAAPPFCLPLAELEGKMPLAADEVLLYPRSRRYFVSICTDFVSNHRSGYRKKCICRM